MELDLESYCFSLYIGDQSWQITLALIVIISTESIKRSCICLQFPRLTILYSKWWHLVTVFVVLNRCKNQFHIRISKMRETEVVTVTSLLLYWIFIAHLSRSESASTSIQNTKYVYKFQPLNWMDFNWKDTKRDGLFVNKYVGQLFRDSVWISTVNLHWNWV